MTQTIPGLVCGPAGDVLEDQGRHGPPLRIVHFDRWESLRPWAEPWDRLARGVPFLSWAWQSAWWQQYGAAQVPAAGVDRIATQPDIGQPASSPTALWVLGVFAPDGSLVGLLPLYCQATWGRGRVLRFLGCGEVCSEYLSILCEPGWEAAVAGALAGWLAQANRGRQATGKARWDVLEMSAVDARDTAVARLAAALGALGHAVHRRPGPPCWRVALAPAWEDFLKPLSRNRRRKLRLLEREFTEGRVQTRCIERHEEIGPAIDRLIEFQRARRRQLGQATCFDSPRFTAFLHQAAAALAQSGQLALLVVEKEGSPLAVELAFQGPDRLYAYQAGIDGSRLHDSPGHLGHYALVRYALDHGLGMLDFLRGDEPYKAEWEAEPHLTLEFRVAARSPLARLRHAAWCAGVAAKAWLRRRLRHAQ